MPHAQINWCGLMATWTQMALTMWLGGPIHRKNYANADANAKAYANTDNNDKNITQLH